MPGNWIEVWVRYVQLLRRYETVRLYSDLQYRCSGWRVTMPDRSIDLQLCVMCDGGRRCHRFDRSQIPDFRRSHPTSSDRSSEGSRFRAQRVHWRSESRVQNSEPRFRFQSPESRVQSQPPSFKLSKSFRGS